MLQPFCTQPGNCYCEMVHLPNWLNILYLTLYRHTMNIHLSKKFTVSPVSTSNTNTITNTCNLGKNPYTVGTPK